MIALATTAIAWVILALTVMGWIVYYFANRNSARPELGSEVELAPEPPAVLRRRDVGRLAADSCQPHRSAAAGHHGHRAAGVLGARARPSGRRCQPEGRDVRRLGQRSVRDHRQRRLQLRRLPRRHEGSRRPGADSGHRPEDRRGRVVNWYAPALNTVLYRFSGDEVQFILNYGRTFSPMSAWGTIGGGPMNAQQIQTIIAYIRSIQLPPRVRHRSCVPDGVGPDRSHAASLRRRHVARRREAKIDKSATVAAQKLVDEGKYPTVDKAMGEALFNLDINSGAYSCARCHTEGWSYQSPGVPGKVRSVGTSLPAPRTPTSPTSRT